MKKTISSIFLLPLLKIDRENLFKNNCINAYVKDKHRDIQYHDCLYVLFKPEDLDVFRDFLDKEYERNKDLIDDYDYEDGFVVLVYKIDDKYDEDIALVKRGKYSETSNSFQVKFPKVLKVVGPNGKHKDEISLQYRIFKKTRDLKEYWEDLTGEEFTDDMEVWEGFHEENETLDLEKVKQEMYEDA